MGRGVPIGDVMVSLKLVLTTATEKGNMGICSNRIDDCVALYPAVFVVVSRTHL